MTLAQLNLWQLEEQVVQRIQAAAPSGVRICKTFDHTDWTADDAPAVGGHLVFNSLAPRDDVPGAAMANVSWSFHTYLATRRCTEDERRASEQLFLAAIRSVIGWQWRPGCIARLGSGPQTGFDGQLARLSVSLIIPAPVTGLSKE